MRYLCKGMYVSKVQHSTVLMVDSPGQITLLYYMAFAFALQYRENHPKLEKTPYQGISIKHEDEKVMNK